MRQCANHRTVVKLSFCFLLASTASALCASKEAVGWFLLLIVVVSQVTSRSFEAQDKGNTGAGKPEGENFQECALETASASLAMAFFVFFAASNQDQRGVSHPTKTEK